MRNEHGMLPLHVAVDEGAPVAVIAVLLESHPSACMERTNCADGRLPLHLAVETGFGKCPCIDTVKLLLRYHSEAANVLDYRGLGPLDTAVESDAGDAVVRLLDDALVAFGLGGGDLPCPPHR